MFFGVQFLNSLPRPLGTPMTRQSEFELVTQRVTQQAGARDPQRL
jgi:hypothetical protein